MMLREGAVTLVDYPRHICDTGYSCSQIRCTGSMSGTCGQLQFFGSPYVRLLMKDLIKKPQFYPRYKQIITARNSMRMRPFKTKEMDKRLGDWISLPKCVQ